MAKSESVRKSTSDVARDRAAFRDIIPALVALVIVQGSLVLIDPDQDATGRTLVWSLLPIVPAVSLVWSQLRCLQRADEYQRKMQFEAMSIGFGVVILISMTAGILDGAGIGNPRQFLQITFIGGVLVWIAALAYLSRPGR